MRTGIEIEVTRPDIKRLEAIVAARGSAQKHVWRARIILLTAQDLGTQAIMAATGKSKPCVWRWQERFMAEGVDGLLRDKTRPPGIAPLDQSVVDQVVKLTLEPPVHEATHWTVRAMAKAVGVAASSIVKIWHDHGLAPHRWRSFKLSNDKAFAEKLHDVVRLYVSAIAACTSCCGATVSEAQMLRIEPYFPLSHGVLRVDDCRVISGIIFVICNGLRWRDVPAEYGPPKTLYNRFIRWSRLGVFGKILAALAVKAGKPMTEHLRRGNATKPKI